MLKKTAKITNGFPDFGKITGLQCVTYAKTVAVWKTKKGPLADPANVLDSIEGDIVDISPMPHNKRSVMLLLVNRKSRFRWVILLPNKKGPVVVSAIKGFFKILKAKYGRFPKRFFFDGGNEINTELQNWF